MVNRHKSESNISLVEPIDFNLGIELVTKGDRDLAIIIEKFGKPSQWKREPGFPTLIQIILEQQVSLASAKATFNRLCQTITSVNSKHFLSLSNEELKAIGFSRQKIQYCQGLAREVLEAKLNIESLNQLDDTTIRKQLKQIKGVGDWTVDMYLMMALQRRNIFPSKDLAVAIAIKEIKNLPIRPKPAELELIAEVWQPYRSIATQILWHYYLNRKTTKKN